MLAVYVVLLILLLLATYLLSAFSLLYIGIFYLVAFLFEHTTVLFETSFYYIAFSLVMFHALTIQPPREQDNILQTIVQILHHWDEIEILITF